MSCKRFGDSEACLGMSFNHISEMFLIYNLQECASMCQCKRNACILRITKKRLCSACLNEPSSDHHKDQEHLKM